MVEFETLQQHAGRRGEVLFAAAGSQVVMVDWCLVYERYLACLLSVRTGMLRPRTGERSSKATARWLLSCAAFWDAQEMSERWELYSCSLYPCRPHLSLPSEQTRTVRAPWRHTIHVPNSQHLKRPWSYPERSYWPLKKSPLRGAGLDAACVPIALLLERA